MSWWRYEKAKGRGSWLISSEVSFWLFFLLTAIAMVAATLAMNLVSIFGIE